MGVDAWDTTVLGNLLGDGIGGLTKYIQDSKNLLTGDLAKVTATLAAIQTRVNVVQSFLNTASSMLNSLNSTGFYIIYLSPGGGDWTSRLTSATNAPDQTGYATGMCAIAKAPNLATVQTKYADMINALQTPIGW